MLLEVLKLIKSTILKLKRKLYLYNLKKNNPKQYALEYKYSPERIKRKFNFKKYCKNNILSIIDLFIGTIGLIIAIVFLLK